MGKYVFKPDHVKTEVIATGEEVLSGNLVDSNSAYLAEQLTQAGIPVIRHTCIGDDVDILADTFREVGKRADIALVTGGLGPTRDDRTTVAAAQAAGVSVVFNQPAMDSLEAFLSGLNRPVSDVNKKQAYLPDGAECLANPIGTAPGFLLSIDRCRFFFLPGVPVEMVRMFNDAVLPILTERMATQKSILPVRTISLFGLPESEVDEKLGVFSKRFPRLQLGFRAVFPEIHVKIYTRGDQPHSITDSFDDAIRWIEQKLGDTVVSVEGEGMAAAVGRLLVQKQATVAVAESCTGGLIAHQLTNVAGSSAFFLFSGVTYANRSKSSVLGVSEDTLLKYGAVHEKTVEEMAAGARQKVGATYGLSTSGIAGPTGGTDAKPVGTVCIGLATADDCSSQRFNFPYPERMKNKQMFAMTALDMLRRRLFEDLQLMKRFK